MKDKELREALGVVDFLHIWESGNIDLYQYKNFKSNIQIDVAHLQENISMLDRKLSALIEVLGVEKVSPKSNCLKKNKKEVEY